MATKKVVRSVYCIDATPVSRPKVRGVLLTDLETGHRVSLYRVHPGMVYSWSAIEMNLVEDPIMALDFNPCADEMSKKAFFMRKERELQLHGRHASLKS
jgi:hypothetical protein